MRFSAILVVFFAFSICDPCQAWDRQWWRDQWDYGMTPPVSNPYTPCKRSHLSFHPAPLYGIDDDPVYFLGKTISLDNFTALNTWLCWEVQPNFFKVAWAVQREINRTIDEEVKACYRPWWNIFSLGNCTALYLNGHRMELEWTCQHMRREGEARFDALMELLEKGRKLLAMYLGFREDQYDSVDNRPCESVCAA